MKLLVVGGSGLLGSNVVAAARRRDWTVTATFLTSEPVLPVRCVPLDVTETDRVRSVVADTDPDAVVNCAAMTAVDDCENAAERARAVNATAAGDLSRVCSAHDVALCHVSTDYVFDGAADTPYAETDDPDPIQTYGRSKLDGERAVLNAHDRPLVVRPSFVYGLHRGADELAGFPSWVRDALTDGEPVGLFDDQYLTPSRAGSTADTLLELLAGGHSGCFHVACRTCTTPYAFGQALADRLDASPDLVQARSRDTADRPADRPADSCLDVGKVERCLGRPQPTLDSALDAIAPAL